MGLLVIVAIGALIALPVMWLWNGCLVPAINGINEIGWLQAWGLFILSGMLFRSTSTKTEK